MVKLISSAAVNRRLGDSRRLRRSYARGELVRLRHGIYIPTQQWLALKPWEHYAHLIQAVEMELPGTQFCYESAAQLWGLELAVIPQHVHVVTAAPGKSGRSESTISAHGVAITKQRKIGLFRHYGTPPAALHNGILVTPLLDTVVELASRLPLALALPLVDQSMNFQRMNVPPLTRVRLLEACQGLPSAARVRRATDVVLAANALAESVGESMSRATMHVLRLPIPELQSELYSDDGIFIARPDFLWREQRVVGEFDGVGKYLSSQLLGGRTPAEAVVAEKRREDAIRSLGFRVARWDWKSAKNEAALLEVLTRAGIHPAANTRKRTKHPGTDG